jgi:competence protein ComEC
MTSAGKYSELPALREWIWQAPLVPPALFATAGLLADRYVGVPLLAGFLALIACVIGWLILQRRRSWLAPVLLWLACACLAALYHHAHRGPFPEDDIARFLAAEPKLMRLRGELLEEPALVEQEHDELYSFVRADPTRCLLAASAVKTETGWQPVSGSVTLTVQGSLRNLHCGDEVEVVGWLGPPFPANNPGEWDRMEYALDRGIRGEMFVKKTPDAVTQLKKGDSLGPDVGLTRVRVWGQRSLEKNLPAHEGGIAVALLLGEGSAMSRAEWDRYVRTGVIHVLAISGQHLVVLAALAWGLLRLIGVRRQQGAIFVAVFLLAYALLTGFRPPVQRAAVTVLVACAGMVFRRQTIPANNFALAWLVVIALNPADPFGMGCQLAFLQVALLVWAVGRWFDGRSNDPIARLKEEARSPLERWLLGIGRWLGRSYGITLFLGLLSLPLIVAWQHLAPVVGLVIGPPVMLLTSIALISGFLLLISEALGGLLTPIFAFITRWSLAGCDGLVDFGDRLPYSHVFVPDLPVWWVWGFYLMVLAGLWLRPLWQRRRWLAGAGLAWLGVGLLGGSAPAERGELRMTFLAVGHGGCTVIETPDGRTLLYDAGAMNGPDVTRRVIAPFLWQRGVRRIDEVFLSHADLDHFNGLAALLERFKVGQVTCTPTFANKDAPGVRRTLAEIERHGVPMRILSAGDRLTAGDVVIEVLHPPAAGPEGNENSRSMVLRFVHRGHVLLLTGDLEGAGQDLVFQRPTEPVDVLMAPHHGSRVANGPNLLEWAKPKLVLSCQGTPRSLRDAKDVCAEAGVPFWGTWPHGAITIRSGPAGLSAETYRTRQRIVLREGG